MATKTLSPVAARFLADHGAEDLVNQGMKDLSTLVRVLRESAPPSDSDPLSQENMTYQTVLLDCLSVMDEQLYEHYRALIDLVRNGVFRAPREKLLAYPSWNSVREKGILLGILPEELYGNQLPHPHLGIPEEYQRIMEGKNK